LDLAVLGASFAALFISIVAVVVAFIQVADARRLSKIDAELAILNAFLQREWNRHPAPREDVLRDLFQAIYTRACSLTGSEEALGEIVPSGARNQ
jgi:hypothetical protein